MPSSSSHSARQPNYLRAVLALFSIALVLLSLSRTKRLETQDDSRKRVFLSTVGTDDQATANNPTIWERPNDIVGLGRGREDRIYRDETHQDKSLAHTDDDTGDDDEDNDEEEIPPSPIVPSKPKKLSLSELASRIAPKSAESSSKPHVSEDGKESNAMDEDEDDDDDDGNEEEGANAKITEARDEETGESEDEEAGAEQVTDHGDASGKATTSAEQQLKPTPWDKFYDSAKCKEYRSMPPGHAAERNVGQGQRSLCSRDPAEKQTIEYRTELGGSVDISILHRAIYLPVMKAGSQMFQEVFKRRLRGRRIYDRELPSYLKKFDLTMEDFFIFTFVREPFSTFVSSYGEVNKYTTRNRTVVRGFASIDDVPENEPKRALACLDDIAKGTFHGLVPAHMHTQLWKVSRCLPDRKATEVKLNFVGHLENLDNDWRHVEKMLNIPHEELPVIHTSKSSANPIPKRAIKFDPPSSNKRFSELTKQVCEYYRADFVCFGYDDSICDK